MAQTPRTSARTPRLRLKTSLSMGGTGSASVLRRAGTYYSIALLLCTSTVGSNQLAGAEDELAQEPKVVQGIVVDDSDEPVADASIRIATNAKLFTARSNANGSFEFELPPLENLFRLVVIATDADEERLGVHTYPNVRDGKIEHVKISLKPAREITGRVLDSNDKPQAGVLIAAVSSYTKLNETLSGRDGQFTLLVPKDSQLSSVVAFSPERGLDYFLFRRKDGLKDSPFPLAFDHSEPLEFRLNGIRKVTVRVQDVEGNSLPNTDVAPWYFEKPRKGGHLNSGLNEFKSKTDENGNTTVFVPADASKKVTIWARRPRYHSPDRWVYDPEEDDRNVVATLEKMVTMSGRIVGAAGKPLEGIDVYVNGAAYSFDGFNKIAKTDQEGRFQLDVNANQFYQVVPVGMKKSTSSKTLIVRRKDVTDVDFKLARAARIHGRVTMGATRLPAAGQYLQLYLKTRAYYDIPEDQRLPNPKNSNSAIAPYIVRTVRTNDKGEFEFYAGPGKYYIIGPRNIKPPEFELTGAELDHVVDLHSNGPERIKTRGAVALKGDPKQRISEAEVSGVAHQTRIQRLRATTNDRGLFEAQRGFAPMRVFARSKDRKLAGFVDIQADEPFVLIPVAPTATCQGQLVDPAGKPIPDKMIEWGVHFQYSDKTFSWLFGGKTTTDKEGRFTMDGLVVGEEYSLEVATAISPEGRARSWRGAGTVTPEKAGEVDIGKREFNVKRR